MAVRRLFVTRKISTNMKTSFKPFRETKSKPPKSNAPKQMKQEKLKLSKTPIDQHQEMIYNQFYTNLKRKGLA